MSRSRAAPAVHRTAGAVPLLGPDSARLWHAQAALEARPRQGAAALAALAQVLRGRGPHTPAQAAFLAFYDAALAAPPADFTGVWTEPAAYYLTHLAYQFLAHALSGAPLSPQARDWLGARGHAGAEEALEDVLERFGAFHLGLALRAGGSARLSRPLEVTPPWHLPGGHWLLEAPRPLRLEGVARGRLIGHAGGEPFAAAPGLEASRAAAVRFIGAPAIEHRGWTLGVNPAAFADLPGLAFTAPVLDAGRAYHERHCALIARTLDRVAAHQPDSYAQLRASVRLIGLKLMDAGDYTNMTYSDLPGCAILAVVEDELDLADTLIHELHHNRLFGLEADGPLFDGAGDNGAVHYSPWRSDPRPLYGLLHAVYVHVPVWHYWRAVWQAGSGTPAQRAYAADRLVRYAGQLARGVRGLIAAPFTAAGRDLYEELRAQTGHILQTLPALGVPDDPPAWLCRADGQSEPERDAAGRALTVSEALRAHVQAVTRDALQPV